MESILPNTPTTKPVMGVGDRDDLDALGKGHNRNELQGVDLRDLGREEVIEPPLEKERDKRADKAQNQALDHERQPNETVRRARPSS